MIVSVQKKTVMGVL